MATVTQSALSSIIHDHVFLQGKGISDGVEGSDSEDTAVGSEQQSTESVCQLLELNKHVQTSPEDEVGIHAFPVSLL